MIYTGETLQYTEEKGNYVNFRLPVFLFDIKSRLSLYRAQQQNSHDLYIHREELGNGEMLVDVPSVTDRKRVLI